MKFVKIFEEYDKFVYLDDLKVPSKSIDYLNSQIKKYLVKIYTPFNWDYYDNKDIEIPEFGVLNSRYISLFINNYTIFRNIIGEHKFSSYERFINYVVLNLGSIYHYRCDYFKSSALPIVIHTVRKGNIGELKTIQKFEEMTMNKGFQVVFEVPTTDEDIRGIDSKVILNNRTYTIQIKPMTDKIIKDGKIIIKSPGCLNINKNKLVVDYLCFYSAEYLDFVFLRNRDIAAANGHFISSTENIVDTN